MFQTPESKITKGPISSLKFKSPRSARAEQRSYRLDNDTSQSQKTPVYARKDFVYCTPPLKNLSSNVKKWIDRDLNSPSAALRVRALHALKNPESSNYYKFDVSHEEIDIICAEDLQARPTTIQEVMKNVVVYVEIRNGEDNRSAGVQNIIADLGARVNQKLLKNTTHVIFKDGLQSTFDKAKNWNIPVVSLQWIEACKRHLTLVDTRDYTIVDLHRYENPELYEKMKRYKYKQPGGEENTKSAKSRRSILMKRAEAESPATPVLAQISKLHNITNNLNISMDESALSIPAITPNTSIVNPIIAAIRRSERRHTIIGSQRIDETNLANTIETPAAPAQASQITSIVKTSSDTAEPTVSTPLPKEIKKPNSRRTIFNISMDVINQRVERMNSLSKMNGVTDKLDDDTSKKTLMDVTAPNESTVSVRPMILTPISTKRKLFTPPVTVKFNESLKRNRETDVSLPEIKKKLKMSSPKKPVAKTGEIPSIQRVNETITRSGRRSTLNFRQTPSYTNTRRKSSAAPRRSSAVLVFTNMHDGEKKIIEKAVKLLGKFVIEDKVTARTSHLVTLEPRRTMNLMRALIRGVWILSYEWIAVSLDKNEWQNEEMFELENFSKAVKICRMERQLFGASYRMKIFADVGSILLGGPMKHNDIEEIVKLCGGTITTNHQEAKYIVGAHRTEYGSKISVTANWIVDCVLNAKCISTHGYCNTLQSA